MKTLLKRAPEAILKRTNGHFSLKIPYNDYLALPDGEKNRLTAFAAFDPEERCWLVEPENLKFIVELLMKNNFQVAILGQEKEAREEIEKRITQLKNWIELVKKKPVVVFLKRFQIRKTKNGYEFSPEGKTVWAFRPEITPHEILSKSPVIKVKGKGKTYTLFVAKRSLVEAMKKKYNKLIKEKAEKAIKEAKEFLKIQENLKRGIINLN